MASRLQRLNGWRRLWLVATAALAIWTIVVWPLFFMTDLRSGMADYRRNLKKEFDSGQCQTYQTATLEALAALPGKEACYLIIYRRIEDKISTVPYRAER